jgi:putative ABC transport system permease protein
LTSKITATLPVERTVPLQTLGCLADPHGYCGLTPQLPAEQQCPYAKLPKSGPERDRALADDRCRAQVPWSPGPAGNVVVDDGTDLALVSGGQGEDLARAQAVLRAGGVVVPDPRYVHDGRIDLTIDGADSVTAKATGFSLPAYALTSGVRGFGLVIGPSALAAHGLSAQRGMLMIATTRVPTTAESDAFTQATTDVNESAWGIVETGPGHADLDIGLIVLALASGIVTLAATAVVTGLAAADGQSDLAALAAVGASPRVRRFMSLSQSGVIAGLGTVLGLAAGAVGAYAMVFALNRSMMERSWPNAFPLPMGTPWLMLTGLLIVPLIAMAGAGMLTRSRLPIERRA